MAFAISVSCVNAGPLDAEAVEKEMQQAALAALAAAAAAESNDASHSKTLAGSMAIKKHKLPADFPAAAAAAGQHLDGEAVEDKSTHDDKSAAQKLSEQIVEQRKVGDSDSDSDPGVVVEETGHVEQAVQAAQQGLAAQLTALQEASQMAAQAQTADLTVLQQEQQAQQLELEQQQQQQQPAEQVQQLPDVVTQDALLQQQLASQAQTAQS